MIAKYRVGEVVELYAGGRSHRVRIVMCRTVFGSKDTYIYDVRFVLDGSYMFALVEDRLHAIPGA